MTTFSCRGDELWYDETGRGDLLVAVHGGLGLDHTYLRPGLDPLAETHRLVFPDLRANGRSGGDGSGITVQSLADDLEALREHLGAERLWVLGHSYGGFVALQYALSYPERLLGLVLCDTGPAGPSGATVERELARLGAGESVLAAFAAAGDTADDMRDFLTATEPVYLPHSPPGTGSAAMADMVLRPEGSAAGDRALEGWDVTGRLGSIAVPTLVVAGADDFLFPPDTAQVLGDGIPGATTVVLEGSGHLPMIDQPDTLLATVRAFLARTQGQ